jgi:hypothetical protein
VSGPQNREAAQPRFSILLASGIVHTRRRSRCIRSVAGPPGATDYELKPCCVRPSPVLEFFYSLLSVRRLVCPITNSSATIAKNSSPGSCPLSTTKRARCCARTAEARTSSSAGWPSTPSRRGRAREHIPRGIPHAPQYHGSSRCCLIVFFGTTFKTTPSAAARYCGALFSGPTLSVNPRGGGSRHIRLSLSSFSSSETDSRNPTSRFFRHLLRRSTPYAPAPVTSVTQRCQEGIYDSHGPSATAATCSERIFACRDGGSQAIAQPKALNCRAPTTLHNFSELRLDNWLILN